MLSHFNFHIKLCLGTLRAFVSILTGNIDELQKDFCGPYWEMRRNKNRWHTRPPVSSGFYLKFLLNESDSPAEVWKTVICIF